MGGSAPSHSSPHVLAPYIYPDAIHCSSMMPPSHMMCEAHVKAKGLPQPAVRAGHAWSSSGKTNDLRR